MKKFLLLLRLNWIKILLFFFISFFLSVVILFLSSGFQSYFSLETFSRKQLSAQMAFFFFIGILSALIQLPIFLGMQYYFLQGGGISKLLGSDSAEKAKADVKWNEVIGMENAKRDAWEIVQFIKDSNKIKAIGGSMIKGVMMIGPPGCGKTYLAKAMATEAGLPFLSAVGSEFVGIIVGLGAARIKSLFKHARKLAKAEGGCIIFIDEIDSFARPRTEDRGFGGAMSQNATVNQFLTELDGLRKKENNIVVLAATNVPPDQLDPAIMRSGRFDRKIFVEKPTAKEREQLIKFYLSKVKAEPEINVELIAEKCQWFSPADINNMVREASILALREQRPITTQSDILKALNSIISSIEKMGEDKILSARVNVKWDDLIGMDETKKDAWEIVELLRDRNRLKVMGGQIIKGVMLIGPPGCGKTYLAKAVATEAGFPFVSTTGSDFINNDPGVGTGALKLKKVFKEAREMAKAEGGCIIFIDEIDAFIRPRDPDPFSRVGGGGVYYNANINQFLAELDGLKGENNNIVILAATNVPEENLDPAVLRSGRFDRKIYLQKPSSKDRQALLKYYLAKIKTDENINIELLADKAKWFSAADISNMVRESGILALREKREIISMDDLLKALERVMASVEVMGENKILGGKVNIKWSEVIGMTDAKAEAWEIVKLLKDRNLLKAIGGKIVKGVVMFGPPGCGKTYLAKAMATESGFPFMSAVGSDLVGIYIGEGAKKMKDIFKEARALAKAEGGCIIFFDEIDSFATPRFADRGWGGGIMHNATVNQFLTELDGLRQQENNIVVLAATNVREQDLDPAITRAGRLERKIYITLPNVQERRDIFKFYLAKVSVEESVDANVLARTTVGFTPSDIDNMIREAGLIAMRHDRNTITHKDLSEAYDRITLGAPSKEQYSKKSITKTAYHEAGHAILTYLTHPTDEVIKATIRPRKNALGFIYSRSIEELQTGAPSKEHLLSLIKIALAGYAAEKITMGTTAAGVIGDFEKVYELAHQMVWSCGMGKSGILGGIRAVRNQSGDPFISEKTKEILDNDVQDILQVSLKETTEILTNHHDVLEYFAQELLKKGDLEYDEIVAIFNKFGLKPATQTNNPSL